jgi:hypothetical protein
MDFSIRHILNSLVNDYKALDQVQAIVLGGSRSTEVDDADSDIDLYVYTENEIPTDTRRHIAQQYAEHYEVGNRNWEPGDEWIDDSSGLHFDVMFRHLGWINEQLQNLLIRYQPNIGYSTCLWFNVLNSEILFDRNNRFASLQQWVRQEYPLQLQQAIIAKNHPLLKSNLSSYFHQLELAAKRNDWPSLQHRTSALLASVFDIIFAVNRQPHPGEKRQLAFCRSCKLLPANFYPLIDNVLSTGTADTDTLLRQTENLIQSVDALLKDRGLLESISSK